MNDAINALAPCPFCGNEAVLGEAAWKTAKAFEAECSYCGASVPPEPSPELATSHWNTRYIESPEPSAADTLSPATEVRREAIAREELMDLAEWALAVPEALLADNSPNARHFKRIAEILSALPITDEAAIREKAFEDAAMIARQVAINAERRSADHTNLDAKQSALDKMAGAQEAEARIRAAANGGKQP